VFVAMAGALAPEEAAEYASFGPVATCDPARAGDAVPDLRDHRPAGITAFSEGVLPLTTELAAGLGLPYHDHDTVVLLTDKWAQRQRLADSGVDAVRSIRVCSRAETHAALARLAGPAVVKPVRSQSSRDTYLVPGPDQLPAEVVPTGERSFVVEEYLPGRGEGEFGDFVSIESLVTDGDVVRLGITGKFPMLPPFREQGHVVPSHLSDAEQDAIAALTAEAIHALGVGRGLVHTEVKLTPGGPRILEVNGRIGGYHGDLYRRITHQDWLALGLAVACGDPVDPVPAGTKGRVEFTFFNQPPIHGGILRTVEGAEAVQREPGITGYGLRVPLGHRYPPDVATAWMDVLEGNAPDHDSALNTIGRCLEHLRFTFEQPDGTTRVWQASRSGLCVLDS
jgi:hypothetical protein